MYQVNASYTVITTVKKQLNALQKFLGADETETTQKEGSVQYTADTINEAITKLQYLIPDISTVCEMTLKRI
jgi:hypothetical protein